MSQVSDPPFNPSLLDENERIPAKIWELLRRNRDFQVVVQRLAKLDAAERNAYLKTGKYHGAAWNRSYWLVRRASENHPFAGVALQWLVPEPLFHCDVATWPLGKKWKQRPAFRVRHLRVGVGTVPNVNDKSWVWRNPNKVNISGHSMVRGPEVSWTTSRFKRLRSLVNPILEWRRYAWPFTVGHAWPSAPAGFRRHFQFIWRRHFDCRPTNPLTKNRTDSPAPYETSFFQDLNLSSFQASGHLTQDDAYQLIRFNRLAGDYRIFAIPKTILTKASADAMGDWLSDELKKGSNLYGGLLNGKLLNEAELLGTTNEWTDWLSRQAGDLAGVHKDTHFYRRCKFMNSLIDLIYPRFQVSELLAPPKHRERGKKYVRK